MSNFILHNLLLIVPLALFILFGMTAVREHHIKRQLSALGEIVKGEVLRRGPLGRYTHVYYRFPTTLSQIHQDSQATGLQHYFRLKGGTKVDVVYLPTKPRISRLANNDADNSARDQPIAICVVCVLLIIMILR